MRAHTSPPSAPTHSEPRTLEAIEQDILGRRQRVEGLEQKLPELRAARTAAEVIYYAARQEAALIDAPMPARSGIDQAEEAIRDTEERIAGLRDSITALEPERRRAQDRQEAAQRDALLEERATCLAEIARHRAEAAAATGAANLGEARIPALNAEITRLNMRVGEPGQS